MSVKEDFFQVNLSNCYTDQTDRVACLYVKRKQRVNAAGVPLIGGSGVNL